MDDPFRGFARLCPREAANDPVAGSLGSAAKLGGDGGFRQIEEGGKRWGLGQGCGLSHCGMCRISGCASPPNGTKAMAELVVPRSMPMEKRA